MCAMGLAAQVAWRGRHGDLQTAWRSWLGWGATHMPGGWLVGFGWLVGWSVGYLVGWLVDCLVVLFSFLVVWLLCSL